jgi:hypothetical protein
LYFDAAVLNTGGYWALYGPNNEGIMEPVIGNDFELSLPNGGGTYVVALKGNGLVPAPIPYTFEIVDPYGGTTPGEGPRIISITVESTTATVTWTSVAGRTYLLRWRDALTDTTWTDVPGMVTATAATADKADTVGASTLRFYQVVEQ